MTPKANILAYFPGEPRPVQREALESLERNWNDYDVFVIQAPTATGKSRIAMTIAEWQKEVDVLTPTNILLQQYVKEFPKFPKTMRHDLYSCYDHCSTLKRRQGKHCQYAADRRRVRAEHRGFMNYYMYLSLTTGWQYREVAPTIVIDEAHNLIPTIQSLEADKLWKHDFHWPDDVETYDHLLRWVKWSLTRDIWTPEQRAKLTTVQTSLDTFKPKYVFERTKELWRRTRIAEERPVILLKPVDIRDARPYFWPQLGKNSKRGVNKVVLMSATIGKKDIEALGLDKHRVLYIDCESAIPEDRRPVAYHPVTKVTYAGLQEASRKVGQYIEHTLLPKHAGEKGVIHATYHMAVLLKEHLGSNPRFIFHDKWNKQQAYQRFLDSTSDHVLVASGLYEGIDLPHELGRWQAIAKVPWQSLGDKAVKYKSQLDPEWYSWQTLKDLCQAVGRVSRTPDDYGVTYILDSTFERLQTEASTLFPRAFKDALRAGERL